MLDFCSNATKLKKWIGYKEIELIFNKRTPQQIAYDLRKLICEWSEKNSILYINNCNGQSIKIEGEDQEEVVKFCEENKKYFYQVELNDALWRVVEDFRKQKKGETSLIDESNSSHILSFKNIKGNNFYKFICRLFHFSQKLRFKRLKKIIFIFAAFFDIYFYYIQNYFK